MMEGESKKFDKVSRAFLAADVVAITHTHTKSRSNISKIEKSEREIM